MGKKWTSIAIIVIAVALLGGGMVALGKSGKAKQSADTTQNADDDQGTVAGATSNDDSGAYTEKLAKFLTEKGAVFYGAYWCPHCKDQKKLFGDAMKYVNYVECDANGENANPDECKAKEIESYPTWIYQGKKTTGTQTLAELAQMVGFADGETAADPESEDLAEPSVSLSPSIAASPTATPGETSAMPAKQ